MTSDISTRAPAPEDAEPVTDARSQSETDATRQRWLAYLEAYALPLCLVLAGVFFTVLPRTSGVFLTTANLQVLFAGQAVEVLVGLALLLPLCADQWDLSVGAAAGLCAVYSASVMGSSGLVVGIVVGLGIGALVGAVNALIVTRLKINTVIATLGTMTIIGGVVQLKTNGVSVVSNIPQALVSFGSGTWFEIPRIVLALVVVALLVHYVLEHTPYGRYLYALGSNPTAARLVGLRTTSLLFTAFVGAGLLAAVGGILAVARSGGADPNLGTEVLLPSFAAAFLSAASIKPGRYNVGGLVVAVYFLAVINNGLSLAGVQSYISDFVNGAALIIGVALATYLGRKRRGE
jgi:ribose transport system permease protein